jgi:hypothetical protein
LQRLDPPSYVVNWEAEIADFGDGTPSRDLHPEPRLGVDAKPAFLRAQVDLRRHQHDLHCPSPCEFEWDVLSGYHRVAEALANAEIAHSAGGGDQIKQEIGRWITEQKERDAESQDWHQEYRDKLAANPAIEAALSKSPDELFSRAGLTMPQELAMRQLLAGASNTEAAKELHISEPSYRERLERAAMRIQELGMASVA